MILLIAISAIAWNDGSLVAASCQQKKRLAPMHSRTDATKGPSSIQSTIQMTDHDQNRAQWVPTEFYLNIFKPKHSTPVKHTIVETHEPRLLPFWGS